MAGVILVTDSISRTCHETDTPYEAEVTTTATNDSKSEMTRETKIPHLGKYVPKRAL